MDEALFKFTEYETRALARIGFEKDLMSWCTRIREKVDLRPAAPDIHQIEFAFNPDVATKMATDFFTSAPQSATLADFQIALSSALVNILSGTAGMDEHLHSSHEARERLRNFTASIIERFSTLVDMESIRESIQLRRTVLGLSGETVDTTASQYIAYRQTGA
jgi:hypothetical protein